MPVKLKYGSNKSNGRQVSIVERLHLDNRFVRYALVAVLGCFAVLLGVLGFYYFKYENVVNDRLAKGPMFASVSQIYAAPREIRNGQKLSASSIAGDLRRAGYNNNTQLGSYQLNGESIFIQPGPESYHSTDGATIYAPDGVVQKITAENGAALSSYELEPQLITALSEENNRTKRRMVAYQDIPTEMVQAVTSIEDRNFFEHSGVNFLRIVKCGVQDLTSGRKRCGGSTITMQLARGFFLSPEKRLKRKFIEILITFQLESRFSKQQIFEMYANQINLGHRGSYDINGFGEASQAFFGKGLKQLDTAQIALLAGMIQSPSRLNPYRHPERAIARRNVVLDSMVETSAISAAEATRAKAEPLRLATQDVDASEAPYFVDLVHDQLVQRISDQDLAHQSLRIYTSLDPDLQSAAADAVEIGMKNVDEIARKLHAKSGGPVISPQVAMVALNPHTGQILALVGGRNYSTSQLDHAVAKRPTGSIFKPFVYATAFNTSLNGTSLGESGAFTAVTHLNDQATTYTDDSGRTYTPRNLISGYRGDVTAAYALAHSLNAATIQLAQMVGFDNVAALARASGITSARGTPSVAIGTYSATPVDMAGAYTVFANGGVHLKPWMLASVRNNNGDIVADYSPEAKQVMDPRAAYLTQSLMEGVMNYGTAAGVRARGFNAPAAGKTGTSHDAWFAGYTSNLICIVWVGNDDYTTLPVELQGAYAATPIWAEFMKRAIKLPQYSDVKSFSPPEGISMAVVDRDTGLLADPACSVHTMNAAFLDGTAPTGSCTQMRDNPQNFFQKIFGMGGHPAQVSPYAPASPSPSNTAPPGSSPANPVNGTTPQQTPQPEQPKKKKNFFQKIFGGGGDKDKQQTQPPQ